MFCAVGIEMLIILAGFFTPSGLGAGSRAKAVNVTVGLCIAVLLET
jgi:hypothetical protein